MVTADPAAGPDPSCARAVPTPIDADDRMTKRATATTLGCILIQPA
jgi:hypothetical protein